MIEIIVDLIGYCIWDFVILNLTRAIIWIGAVVFSVFSFFEKSTREHYNTENFDKKLMLFFTGFFTLIIIGYLVHCVLSFSLLL